MFVVGCRDSLLFAGVRRWCCWLVCDAAVSCCRVLLLMLLWIADVAMLLLLLLLAVAI